MKSKNDQQPETSNQEQPIMARVFVATNEIEHKLLCNYRVIGTAFFLQELKAGEAVADETNPPVYRVKI